jgi:hypothetical protein
VNAKDLHVTANDKTITYGDPTPDFDYTVNTGELVSPDTAAVVSGVTCSAGAGPFTHVGSPYAINCSGGSAANYNLLYVAGKLTVNAKPLTITANNQTKILGEIVTFSGTEYTVDGLVIANGDSVTSVTLTSNGALASAGIGEYQIVPSNAVGSGLDNYTITYVNGILDVNYAPEGTMCLGSPGHVILQPINTDGSSVFKQKSTVPAKFRVCDANGVSVGTPGVVSSFRLIQISNGTVSNIDEAVDSTTPDTAFRWSADGQQWIFNINTKSLSAGKTYVYLITLNDGSTIQFQFGLK